MSVEIEQVVAHAMPGTEWIPEGDSRDFGGVIEDVRGWALLDSSGFVDGGAQMFLCCLKLQGNTTVADVQIFNPAGVLIRQLEVAPPGFDDGALEKYDSTTLIRHGRDFTVFGTTHKAVSDANRPNRKVYYTVEGAVIPSPTEPISAPYDMRALGQPTEPGPGTGGITLDQIRDLVNNAITGLRNSVEQLSKNGAYAALEASLQRGALKDAFAQQGITGDALARAFWQEPFASRFRLLLKQATYEMGRENQLWGLRPAEGDEARDLSADELQNRATYAAEQQAMGSPEGSAPAFWRGAPDAPVGPLAAAGQKRRRGVGRSIDGSPAPVEVAPPTPPPDDTTVDRPAPPMVAPSEPATDAPESPTDSTPPRTDLAES